MRFDKPPLTLEQQADLLLARGLLAEREVLLRRLSTVNYYRLSTYLYPFRNADHMFRKDTTLELVWQRYSFDRRLRLIVLDAVERIEVAVRTRIAYVVAQEHGPFAYDSPLFLPEISLDTYTKWFLEIREEIDRSHEPFIHHFRLKYGEDHCIPPIWMAVEVMSFGKMLTLYRGIDRKLKKQIASHYNVSDTVFLSWLVSINHVRNICAHHGRLIGRPLNLQPKIPREQKYPDWHEPVKIQRDQLFSILTILRYILSADDQAASWSNALFELLLDSQNIPLEVIGFPANWDRSRLWIQ
ncbi:MAG: Abi family protein [Bacteroidetes bacterium]|nr:Abi family protein [Bacteroidota bacterium]